MIYIQHQIGVGLIVESETEDEAIEIVEKFLLETLNQQEKITHVYAINIQKYQ